MKLKNIIKKTRSYRRFQGHRKIPKRLLYSLIDLARFSPTAGNKQPLKFIVSNTKYKNDLIFPTLKLARDLVDWNGPDKKERPSGYIVILADTRISKQFAWDAAIGAWSILLGATVHGIGGCMIASVDRDSLRSKLKIKKFYEIPLVVILGKPSEKIILKNFPPARSVRYYRDKQDRHIVPKRTLKELILKN